MRFTIGAKLIGFLTLVLLVSITVIVGASTELFVQENAATVQQINRDRAESLASQLKIQLDAYLEQFALLGDSAVGSRNFAPSHSFGRSFLKDRSDILMVHLYANDFKGPAKLIEEFVQEGFENYDRFKREQVILLSRYVTEERPDRTPAQKPPRIEIVNLGNAKSLVLILPVSHSHYLVAWLSLQRLSEAFLGSEIEGGYLVDKNGLVLLRTDGISPKPSEYLPTAVALKSTNESRLERGQFTFQDPNDGVRQLASFRAVGLGDLTVVMQVPEIKALEGISKLQDRAKKIALVVLGVSLIAGFLFSESIASPLRELVEAAERLSVGDYKVKLRPRGRDELGELARAFNSMCRGLEERNLVKETFNKFHNKEIADQLLNGNNRLGGERKEAAVLFMDLRDFTHMTELMEPEKVVAMLNEYMTRMVAIIRTYGGVVDKYIGDSIMALWGVPDKSPEDCFRAVRCCLELREELRRLNQERMGRGEIGLRIGMGLSFGNLIAGNIGSPKKMEYTVVGDTVNLASRLQSATKDYQTDFLVSRNIYDVVSHRFVFESCQNAKVKGKTKEVEIYKVKGYIAENGEVVMSSDSVPQKAGYNPQVA